MAIYQDPTGELYDDMGGTALELTCWPQGMRLLTDTEVDSLRAPTEKQRTADCKAKAQQLLQATDWAILPDVTTGSHWLTNQAEFLAYRSALRALAVNPVADPAWPALPMGQWT